MTDKDSPDAIDLNKMVNYPAREEPVDPGSDESTIRKWLHLADVAFSSGAPNLQEEEEQDGGFDSFESKAVS